MPCRCLRCMQVWQQVQSVARLSHGLVDCCSSSRAGFSVNERFVRSLFRSKAFTTKPMLLALASHGSCHTSSCKRYRCPVASRRVSATPQHFTANTNQYHHHHHHHHHQSPAVPVWCFDAWLLFDCAWRLICCQFPDDVDRRVMASFLEFYHNLTGFVNFRLYHCSGLHYPPSFNRLREAAGESLYSLILGDAAAEAQAAKEVEDAMNVASSSTSTTSVCHPAGVPTRLLDQLLIPIVATSRPSKTKPRSMSWKKRSLPSLRINRNWSKLKRAAVTRMMRRNEPLLMQSLTKRRRCNDCKRSSLV
jgi:hypothetical protein